MSISNSQFEALIERLQAESTENPVAYRRNTFLLTLAGFVAIGGLLLGIAGLVVASVWLGLRGSGAAIGLGLKLGIPAVLIGRVIVGCLWIPREPPEGLPLTRGSAPALEAMIEDIRKRLKAPGAHQILFTADLNAGIIQVPRLGPFGWYENYLMLGLPLMSALPPAEFAAVLAHEFGHLSREDGRLGAWVYRARMTWGRISERLEGADAAGSGYIKRAVSWYAPYFNAYTFVLARQQEFEADRQSAALVGAPVAGAMLARTETLSRTLDSKFMPEIRALCATLEAPPADVVSRMIRHLRSPQDPAETRRWLDLAIGLKTNNADTHPALGDRLRALSLTEAASPAAFQQSAAQRYLGSSAAEIEAKLNRSWLENALAWWKPQHEELVADAARAEALRVRAGQGTQSLDEAWELAWRTANAEGHEAAHPHALAVLRLDPAHAGANFIVGSALCALEDSAGAAHLEKAAGPPGEFTVPALERLKTYWESHRRYEDAADCTRRLNEFGDLVDLANEERRGITTNERVLPHGLGEQELAPLREDLSAEPRLLEAYLVRKEVLRLPEQPFFILGLVPDAPWYKPRSASADTELVQALAAKARMPGPGIVISLVGDNKAFLKHLSGAGEPIHRKA